MIFKKIKSFKKIFGGRSFQMNHGFYIVKFKNFKDGKRMYSLDFTMHDVVESYTYPNEMLYFTVILVNERKEIFAYPNHPFCIKRL